MTSLRRVRQIGTIGLLSVASFACSFEERPREEQLREKHQQAQFGDEFAFEIQEGPSHVQDWASSVGMLVKKSRLPDCSGPNCQSVDSALCNGDYAGQPGLGSCTAFQIGPKQWATAGHCILPAEWEIYNPDNSSSRPAGERASLAYQGKGCGSLAVLRNVQRNDVIFDQDDDIVLGENVEVMNCTRVLSHGPYLGGNIQVQNEVGCRPIRELSIPVGDFEQPILPCDDPDNTRTWPFCSLRAVAPEDCLRSQTDGDWAVFEVDVEDSNFDHYLPTSAAPATIFDEGASLTALMHPSGMPMKYASGELDLIRRRYSVDAPDPTDDPRKVRSALLGAPIDHLPGSSGSPVFGSSSGVVRGLLIQGASTDKNGNPLTENTISGSTCVDHVRTCKDPDDASSTGVDCAKTVALSTERLYVEEATPNRNWPPKPHLSDGSTPFFVGMTLGVEGHWDDNSLADSIQFIYFEHGVQVVATRDGVPRDCSEPGCNLHYLGYMQYGPGADPDPQSLINMTNLLSGYFSNPLPTSSLPDVGPDLLMQVEGEAVSISGMTLQQALADMDADGLTPGGNVTEFDLEGPPDLQSYLNLSVSNFAFDVDDYVELHVVNVDNVQEYDDVLAVRADGTYDVYCGGRPTTSGLELCTDEFLAVGLADSSGDGKSDSFSIRKTGTGFDFIDIKLRQRWSECAGQTSCDEFSSDEYVYENDPPFNYQANGEAVRNNPSEIAVGNFNGDYRARDDWDTDEVYSFPNNDIVVLVGGMVLYYESNTYAAVEYQGPPPLYNNNIGGVWDRPALDIETSDVNQDGFDDLIVSLWDGSIRTYWGSVAGLTPDDYSTMSGLPTVDGNDGRFIVMSTEELATFATLETHLKIHVAGEEPEVAVQIFDADMGGLHEQGLGRGVRTCYQLWSDPCEDLTGTCLTEGGAELVTAGLTSDFLADDEWSSLYTGPTQDFYQSGSGDYVFRLIAYFTDDGVCDHGIDEITNEALEAVDPSKNLAESALAENNFKVRANGDVSYRFGQLKLIGIDGDQNPDLPWMRSTTFDGTMDLFFPVADSVETESGINFREADADDLGATPPGVALNANHEIAFTMFGPSGPVKLGRSETQPAPTGDLPPDPSSTETVEVPSGNYDGEDQSMIHYRVNQDDEEFGEWNWHWEGVPSYNALMMWTPTASPVTYEVYGRPTVRRTTSSVLSPVVWWGQSDGTLEGYLPLAIGLTDQDGIALGDTIVVDNTSDMRAVLAGHSTDVRAVLRAEALALELNLLQAEVLGERLRNALIYGSTLSVYDTIVRVRRVLTNPEILVDPSELAELIALLRTANSGYLTYFRPGVPYPAELVDDDDGDGVENVADNCPSVANPSQMDENLDGVGDACPVVPIATCVLEHEGSEFIGIFGYENPLAYRSVPIGPRNSFAVAEDRGQPITFDGGLVPNALAIRFDTTEVVTWTLEGQTVQLSAASSRCPGTELLTIEGVDDVAIYASDQLLLRDRAEVRAASQPGSIVGGNSTELGAVSITGDLWSRGDVTLRSNALVDGRLVSGGSVTVQQGGQALGGIAEQAYVTPHDISWVVDFPGEGASRVVEPQTALTLSPGRHGSIDVRSGSYLRLQSGVYYLDSLTVEPEAVLSLDQLEGQVVVYVRDSFTFRGEIVDEGGLFPNFLVGYFGSTTSFISAPFKGVLIAPNGRINLEAVGGEGHQGVFFGQVVEIAPDTTVTYVPAGPPYLSSHPPELTCSDSVMNGTETDIDCGGACPNTCQNGQGCSTPADCDSWSCLLGTCSPTEGPIDDCSANHAVDLGQPGTETIHATNACLMVQQYPSWWGIRSMQLQTTGTATSGVPFEWSNRCGNVGGSGMFTGTWESQYFGPTDAACVTLIELLGDGGGQVSLRYY